MRVGLVTRDKQALIEYLLVENEVLRGRQGPKRVRFTACERRKLVEAGERLHELSPGLLREHARLATPDSLRRWFQEFAGKKYDSSGVVVKRGRPRIPSRVVELIVEIARKGRDGITRIRDRVRELGHDVGRSTVLRVLARHGISPAPERNQQTTWKEFLRQHWEGLAAMDFFHVEVMTHKDPVRVSVLFVMEVKTRRVEICGLRENPDGAWCKQIARNLTDPEHGFLVGKDLLLVDRDPVFTEAFKHMLDEAGTKVLTLPPKSPNLNAYAERFVRSIKEECLDRMILFGVPHLRHVLREYMAHYHAERHHQGLDSRLIDPPPKLGPSIGSVACKSRLGGLLRHYYRRAA